MEKLTRAEVQPLIELALKEDGARRDATVASLFRPQDRIRARVVAKKAGRAAGLRVAALTFRTVDPKIRCAIMAEEGGSIRAKETLMELSGPAGAIFAAERTALNFIGQLSGVATLTAQFVERVSGTGARIYDTRKTTPGLRVLQKAAVRAGGGENHRMGLHDMVMIKTNELRALGTVRRDAGNRPEELLVWAVRSAKRRFPRKPVAVEVTRMSEYQAVLSAGADIILLDNWPLRQIRRAAALRSGNVQLEATGRVSLSRVRALAETGVQRISVGALTHSAPVLDVSLVLK